MRDWTENILNIFLFFSFKHKKMVLYAVGILNVQIIKLKQIKE